MQDVPPTLALLRGIDAHAAAQAMQTPAQCDETSEYLSSLQAAIEVRKREIMPGHFLTTLLETHRVKKEDIETDACEYESNHDQILQRVGYFFLGGIRLSFTVRVTCLPKDEMIEGGVEMSLKREAVYPTDLETQKLTKEQRKKQHSTIWSFYYSPSTYEYSTTVLSCLKVDAAATLLSDSGVQSWEDRVSDDKPPEENASGSNWDQKERADDLAHDGVFPQPVAPHPHFSPDEKRVRSFASNLVLSLLEIMSLEPKQTNIWSKSELCFSVDTGADKIFGAAVERLNEASSIPCPSFAQMCHNIKTMRNYESSRFSWSE